MNSPHRITSRAALGLWRALRARVSGPGLLLATLLLPALLLPVPSHAAPKAAPWPRWEQHDEGNRLHIDHGAWNDFLLRNVVAKHPSGINRVRYGAVSQVDRLLLERYLEEMARVPISTYSRRAQKSYWINVYNALTLNVVLTHYPVESIRDIDLSPGLFANGPWDAKLITVEGIELSLNDIEHRILRPGWRDNRVHYALNCASLGCPNLAAEAYSFFNIERLLEDGAHAYVNHPRGVHFEGDRLVVSSIYDWYMADFGGDEAGVLAHLRKYAEPALAERLAEWEGGFDDAYDWRLNAP